MENKIVLEVGVSDGYDTEKLIKRFNLPLYGFEPVPYLYDILNKKFSNNSLVHLTQAAVDLEDGEKLFHISNPKGIFEDGTNRKVHPYGCSSLHNFNDNLEKEWPGRPDFRVVESILVKTMRLETFFDQNNFNGEIVYLHCDAQGNDVNVLTSLGKYIRTVKEGVIEVASSTELYKDTNNTVAHAVAFFDENGFKYDFPKGLSRHETDIHFMRID